MGWSGIVILGLVVGGAGWWLHPMRRAACHRLVLAFVAGVLGAALANAAGGATGLFHDGELLQWPLCTALALVFVGVCVALRVR